VVFDHPGKEMLTVERGDPELLGLPSALISGTYGTQPLKLKLSKPDYGGDNS